MLHSSSHTYSDCIFCGEEGGTGLAVMMSQALMAKHAINQSQGLIGYIDVIMKLQEPCNAYEAWAAHQYRQYQAVDERDEFLKRQYVAGQFKGKIGMLTQYYKFHSDIPRVVELGIQKILGKYYDKKRQHDYKKIKRVLKQQQGLSITSVQQSQSSMADSMIQKKSRYSTLLDELQNSKVNQDNMMSDSKLLKDMCKVIEKALPTTKLDPNFQIKGSFNSVNQDRVFQEYLKQQERRLKPKIRNLPKKEQNNFPRRFNLQQLLKKRQKKTKEGERQKQKQSVRDSRQSKKRQKDKFIYNTNIKIQIKNAMFYSQGQQPPLQLGNIEYENGNKVDARFRKKNLINQVNYLNQQSNKKLISDIYKSTQQDLKRRMQNTPNRQRLTTKQSMNRSQSKDKKRSLSKQNVITRQLKKGTSGSTSARRIVYKDNQWALTNNKLPIRSTSASNLKKRSYSTNGITGVASLTTLPRKSDKFFEKRPIESISKYGSSDIKTIHSEAGINHQLQRQREKRAISIKEMLNRKLTFKKQ